MDITPIYELRTRLRAAAFAGTNLLAEDFRLRRAVESVQPLEALSPVFAKIGQLARQLLEPGQTEKEGLLLDTITLVDAFLCTQGTVAVSGDICPLQTQGWGKVVMNAPYSVVKTLLDALQNSGSGRYSYVMDMHEKRPELFEDYRIKAALVNALGASYTELAEQAAEWLTDMGETVLQLLERDFDPKGKREMVRRVQVIEAVAAGRANEFYLAQLPEAGKEVRQALIYALRHAPENLELLIGLTGTEKGNARKMAYFALACQEGEEAAAFWSAYMKKKPEETLGYLQHVETEWASGLVAEGFAGELEALEQKPDALKEKRWMLYLQALPGKSGEAILSCYRRAAALKLSVKLAYSEVTVPELLREAMLLKPSPELFALAEEFYETYGNMERGADYLAPAVTAVLLSGSRFDRLSEWLKDKKRNSRWISALAAGLAGLCWDGRRNGWVICSWQYNPAEERRRMCIREVKLPVRGAFTELLLSCRNETVDERISVCVPPEDEEYRAALAKYFYQRALVVSDNRRYCQMLRRCGGTECRNLAVNYFKKRNQAAMWELISYIDQLPGSAGERRQEALRLVELLKCGQIKGQNMNMERLEQHIQEIS